MHQINDLWIGANYAIYAPNRKVELTLLDLIVFNDGSSANLKMGTFENKSINLEFVIVKLAVGENHFKFGRENENPQKVTGKVSNIEINYPGVVQIIPSDSETSLTENHLFFASIADGVLIIVPVSITEITYIHSEDKNISFTGMSLNQNSASEIPLLIIHAPSNINISGNCKAICFTEIGEINLHASIISGNKAKKIIGHQKMIVDVPVVIDSITIKATGNVLIANQLQCPTIDINTTGKVKFYKPVHCNTIKVNNTGKIIFDNLFCTDGTFQTTSSLLIANGIVTNLYFTQGPGELNISLLQCKYAQIKTVSEVSLKVAENETSVDINSVSQVKLDLDIARQITVNNVSGTTVTANKFLSEPVLKSVSKSTVTTR